MKTLKIKLYSSQFKMISPAGHFINLAPLNTEDQCIIFTGRKDKKGNELYNNDIIKWALKNEFGSYETGMGYIKYQPELAAYFVVKKSTETADLQIPLLEGYVI